MDGRMRDSRRLTIEMLGLMPIWFKRVATNKKKYSELPPGQVQALLILLLCGRPALNMTELAKGLEISRQQLTKMADTLCERGFIERTVSPESRREVLVSITDEGRALCDLVIKEREKQMELFLSPASDEEKKTILDACLIVKRLLEEDLGEEK